MYQTILKRQLEFIGHILRLPEEEPARIYALYEPTSILGKTKRGAPSDSYHRYIAKSLFETQFAKTIPVAELERYTKDKEKWKQLTINRLKTVI